MSRREEVEKVIAESYRSSYLPPLEDFARTMADEVDTLRGSLTALGEKATRYEHEREVNAGLVADRDAVITKLLEMLHEAAGDEECPEDAHCPVCPLYNRALEIAGRNG